jgi:hypothetical protein
MDTIDLNDAAQRALMRSEPEPVREEKRPARRICVMCEKEGENTPAKYSDGLCDKHSEYQFTTGEIRRAAREHLERDGVKYAELHMQAAEVAAKRGRSRPMEWALLHTRIVEPVAKEDGASGVVVNVGVVLPGLRES